MRLFLSAGLLLALLPTRAVAQTTTRPRLLVTVGAGVGRHAMGDLRDAYDLVRTVLDTSGLGGTSGSKAPGVGLDAAVAVSYRLLPKLSVGLVGSYLTDGLTISITDPEFDLAFDYKLTLRSLTAEATAAYYPLDPASRWQPYGRLGLGYGFAKGELSAFGFGGSGSGKAPVISGTVGVELHTGGVVIEALGGYRRHKISDLKIQAADPFGEGGATNQAFGQSVDFSGPFARLGLGLGF